MFGFWKRKRPTIVLGQQLAEARAAEIARLESEPHLQSPMPKETYPIVVGVHGLLNPKMLPLDTQIANLCRNAAALDAISHANLSRAISMDEFYTLLDFSRRMALFAIRANSSEGLREGVEALALIELERIDYRDIFVALGVLGYACVRVGQDPRQLFEDASNRADQQIGEILRQYAQKSFVGKKLSELSYLEEVTTKYGQCFLSTSFDKCEPTVDLVSVAVEIAEMLEADKYPSVGMQIATTLPSVWLRSVGETEVRAALEDAVAGVSVSAFPAPGARDAEDGHSLLIFLTECGDEARASKLASFAREANHTSHAVIGCNVGRLFCLVIAHSIMHGVAPVETAASLTRFEAGISIALRRAIERG